MRWIQKVSAGLMAVALGAVALADQPAEAETPEDEGVVEAVANPWPQRYRGQVTADSPHYDLELLYATNAYDEGLAAAKTALAAAPDDVDLYWHNIRFMYEIGERFGRDDTSIDKEAHYAQMVALADKGLVLRPGDPHLLFAKGVAMGRLGTTRGVLSSLFMAKDIESAWLTAVGSGFEYASLDGNEQMPCDVDLGLAIYYRLVPDSWIVSVIAGTRGSLEKSIAHATRADACAPNTIRHVKELGVAQICHGTREKDPDLIAKGQATLRRIAALPVNKATEKIDKVHAEMLLADPDLACGYSRDGQQDVDASKLEK